MSQENQEFIEGNGICSITKCMRCGALHLNYRYVRLHLSFEDLRNILAAIYTYEKNEELQNKALPFKFVFGIASLTVYHSDYYDFKEVIESIVLKVTELPESVMKSLCRQK